MRTLNRMVFLFIWASSFWTVCGQEPSGAGTKEMRRAFKGERYRSVIEIYQRGQSAFEQNGEARYLVGFAWMRLHRPDRAKGLLGGISDGFTGCPAWESTTEILERIGVIEAATPPLLLTLNEGKGAHLRVFARETSWARPVIGALSRYRARAREVFGEEAPPIDLLLLEKRATYERFFRVLFEQDSSFDWQDGTGNVNVAIFCEENREGRPARLGDGPEGRVGDVFHEYGHALLATYYGDGYLRSVPQWLNEGLAMAIAGDVQNRASGQSRKLISAHLRRSDLEFPLYRDLCMRLYYDQPDLGFALARLMIERLLEDREPTAIREILDAARPQGDFKHGLDSTTGHDGLWAYLKVIADS